MGKYDKLLKQKELADREIFAYMENYQIHYDIKRNKCSRSILYEKSIY